MVYKASDLFSGTWQNIPGITASWESNQNSMMRGFCVFVDGYDEEINGGKSVFYEGEYYYEWGYTFKDSDLDGILEISQEYKELIGEADGLSYVLSSYDEVVGRYFSSTAVTDRLSDNGIWSRNPNSYDGTFSGDELGIFEIDVALEFTTTESADYLWGSTGNEEISSGGGDDIVMARAGNDNISGDSGDDKLYGGYGNDTISGGTGNDTIDGGEGIDTFLLDFDSNDYLISAVSSVNSVGILSQSNSNDYQITNNNDGIDTIKNIEKIIFNDIQIDTGSINYLTESQSLSYLASHPDLINAFGLKTIAATNHYYISGQSEGRSLDAFNATNYLEKYSDLATAFGSDTAAAIRHYITSGYGEGRTDSTSDSGGGDDSSSALTEAQALTYIASNPDLINAFGTNTEAAIAHYTSNGQAEGRSLDSFNATNYLANYADLAAAFGTDTEAATRHYITSGYAEGRSSSIDDSGSTTPDSLTEFEALNYIASHGDLINAFGTDTEAAIAHYTNNGQSEGRDLDNFDEWGYLASNNDLLNDFGSDTTAAVEHYITSGFAGGLTTNGFNASSYLNNYSDLQNAFGDNQDLATRHYVEHGFNEGRTVVA